MDPRARGRLLKWLFFLSNTLHADLRIAFYTERYADSSESIAALRMRLRARVMAQLALLDAEIARHDGPWLMGAELSVCDVYLAACVRWVQLYPRGDAIPTSAVQALPRLSALLQTLDARPAVRKAFAAEGISGSLFIDPEYPANPAV